MHAVLNLKPDRPDAQAYKSLEQTLVEAGLRSLFTHDDRTELAVVPDKDHMLRALQNRNQCLRLRRLS